MRTGGTMLAAIGMVATLAASTGGALDERRTTLDIYVIDVEGGNATLFVASSGESLLIDTGNAGGEAAVRDASRILDAARDARLTRIDHLITTHWHADHFGGMEELAKRLPIRHFIDHGPNRQPAPVADQFLADVYPRLTAAATHTVARPGDRIAIAGLDVVVLSSAGEVLKTALPGGGGPNPYCASFRQGDNNIEDPLSVGTFIRFGRFRTVHLGDLTKNKEFELMCPANRVGTIDLLLGLHHGQNTSTSDVLMHAVRPRVAIINDGTRKGGQPDVMRTIFSSPGLENVWETHASLLSGQEYTVPGLFIANLTDDVPVVMEREPVEAPAQGFSTPAPVHNGLAYWIKVTAEPSGTFTVTNSRNGFARTYPAGRGR